YRSKEHHHERALEQNETAPSKHREKVVVGEEACRPRMSVAFGGEDRGEGAAISPERGDELSEPCGLVRKNHLGSYEEDGGEKALLRWVRNDGKGGRNETQGGHLFRAVAGHVPPPADHNHRSKCEHQRETACRMK